MFPRTRPRRLRMSPAVRDMVRETELSVRDLIYPMFVDETLHQPRAVPSMPGVMVHSISGVAAEARKAERLGIPAVLLFGVPEHKDDEGSEAWNKNGIVQRAVRIIKKETDLAVITDLCLCEYTSHGHCGILRDGMVDNDQTLERYALTAVSQADAGADMIAPSGMMDGQVAAIREALDDAGYENVAIMSYSAKYGSAFYGPFRDAAGSAPRSGDRRSHQMDPGNRREAMREMRADIEEGADILMVKPAIPCLDIIREARDAFDLPLVAYNVSGEYAMIKAAAANGWLDGEKAMMESLLAIKRAGADIIITYFAMQAARRLRGD